MIWWPLVTSSLAILIQIATSGVTMGFRSGRKYRIQLVSHECSVLSSSSLRIMSSRYSMSLSDALVVLLGLAQLPLSSASFH
jgi:hypothetical protein